jgi:hypothetical protein
MGSLFDELPTISGAASMPTSSDRKVTANRANAKHSTGPKSNAGKAKSRLNALKHGLRAEQVVIPGEDPRAFEAECAAWSADWQPRSYTRAILVERAAVTSWRLRRCVRIEATRLRQMSLNNLDAFDEAVGKRVLGSVNRLRTEPAEALAELMNDPQGISALIDLWNELADAAELVGGWCEFPAHHDRMLTLMGFDPDADCADVGPIATSSFRLVITNDPTEGVHVDGPLSEQQAKESANALIDHCEAKVDELTELLAASRDPDIARFRYADEVGIDLSDSGKHIHRYEMSLDRMLRATIGQLIQLEKTGADLAEDEPEMEVVVESAPAPNEATEEVVKEALAPNEATNGESRIDLRDRGGRVWGLEDGSNPLVGDVGGEIDKV